MGVLHFYAVCTPYLTGLSDLHYLAGMIVKRLSKSGHSFVVTIPRPMVERLWLQVGDYVKLEDVVEGILVRPLEPRAGARVKLAAVGAGKAKK